MDINLWIKLFTEKLKETFRERIWFMGLQGSYAREEATENSDIDVVVILDEITKGDISKYGRMLDEMPEREKICGFLSGKREILNWEPSDLFQFCLDTIPFIGTLEEVFSKVDEEAIDRAIKSGAGNIYHGCVHNMLHEKSNEILKGLLKTAGFVLQASVYRKTGEYVRHLKDLILKAEEDDCEIAKTYLEMKRTGKIDFEVGSAKLFEWSKKKITG